MLLWWETGFGTPAECDHENAAVLLSTAPGHAPTHWGQLLLVSDSPPRMLRRGQTVVVEGMNMLRDTEFRRNYFVSVGEKRYSIADATDAK